MLLFNLLLGILPLIAATIIPNVELDTATVGPKANLGPLTTAEIAHFDAFIETIQPGPYLNFSDPIYASFVDAVLHRSYLAPHLRNPTQIEESQLSASADESKTYGRIDCATSAASPTREEYFDLLNLIKFIWRDDFYYCPQRNGHGSKCTNYAEWRGASLGICGDKSSGDDIECTKMIRAAEHIFKACASGNHVGGQQGLWTFGGGPGSKPHNRVILH
ncbi:hypothetical protein BJ508DRAFT_414763 [Ascobolus immersus RN42]|uniref:Secreted protein n=1 Tax=Ascobolus immersus RN42 TaxID=1160509 RepID=A0A3N4I5D6_ASCIM|nr:hypothetical protein BJ508DRAFT_414763 [Ascobolus immersus RN42]